METFARDRDLAILEPWLYRDMAWLGQTLCRGTANVSGTILEATAVDNAFTAAPVEDGMVVVVGGAVLEVRGVLGETFLEVSMLRSSRTEDSIAPGTITGATFHLSTFKPQIGVVHRQVLAALGLRPMGEPLDERMSELAILNPRDLDLLETHGALHIALAAGGALQDRLAPINVRAERHKRLFGDERAKTTVRIDTDGDGAADVVKGLRVGRFVVG